MHRLTNHVLFLGYSEEESAEKETLSPKLIVYDAISRVESDKVYDDIEFFLESKSYLGARGSGRADGQRVIKVTTRPRVRRSVKF